MGEDFKNIEFDAAKLVFRRVTLNTTSFNQLQDQSPYDQDYHLRYQLLGKVNKKRLYAVFEVEDGLRKWDISNFNTLMREASLSSSIANAVHPKGYSFELGRLTARLYEFFRTEGNFQIERLLEDMKFARHYNFTPSDEELFEHELKGDFKDSVLEEYQAGLEKLRRRNKLVEEFIALTQIFL